MVHFNYQHLTRNKKLEELISNSIDDLNTERSQINTVYCFLSRAFDNRDKLICRLKLQIRLKNNESLFLESQGCNFKTSFKTMYPDLEFVFNKQASDLASA